MFVPVLTVAIVLGNVVALFWLAALKRRLVRSATLLGIAFVTVAAACGIDAVPWHRVRIALAVSVVALVAAQSLSLFVSRGFWPPNLADAFPYPQ